ncbi:methyltransferase domain-containing protein [Glaciimonas sp. GS1]|uniref:Methyltransferase domain-containing protein n=2 Tax=Glaciimonas soli TaxID=2590999 RepID=A0A843YN18_9BURK|nr:methyltransferase domain-containing protein [Glaciimonas soli]
MPWDKGDVPLALQDYVRRTTPATVLIPGCGAGYEVAYLAEAGWNVTAIDFSAAAVTCAQTILCKWAPCVVQADFFTFVPRAPLNLIYERAFFCALPPKMRPQIVQRWAELLPVGGQVAGFFFFDDHPKGPPFGIARPELEQLLHPYFDLIEDQPVSDSIAVFAGKERWQVWRRKP